MNTKMRCLAGVLGGLAGLALAGCTGGPRPLSQAEAHADQYHRLVGVVSGDTLVVEMPEWSGPGRREVNVHLIGVSAPTVDAENARFLAKRAQEAVAERLAGQGWVRLEFNNPENRPLVHYDGSLATDQECYVFVPPPNTDPAGHEELLNVWVLDEGLAARDHGIAEDDRGTLGRYATRMDEAARRAELGRRGLWTLPRG